MDRYTPFNIREDALPPEEVKILGIKAEVYADRKRIKVSLEVTPFKTPPDVELLIMDSAENIISEVDIVNNVDYKLSLVMHLRTDYISDKYQLISRISYAEMGMVHEKSIWIEMPPEEMP